MQQKLLDGRYEVSGLLGSGGMAKVYLAHDEVLGRDVALKVLREQYAENDEFVERFRREAQAAASLSHPNIVSIYDRGRSDGGSYYIVMEYVPGGTLKDRIVRDGPVEPDRAAELVSQIAGALGAAHERGVIHRDVKPQNVLLTASGAAKVADFGIARAASEASLSGASVILGTVSYMSPEQSMGKTVGPQSDLYSLGVVLHEMLAGSVPLEAETPMAVSMKHVYEPVPPLRETATEVPEGLNAIRKKLLAKRPEDRYANTAEVVEDLQRVRRGEQPLLAGPASPASDAPTEILSKPYVAVPRRRRWRPFVLRTAAALIGVSGLVGVFGWGLTESQGRQPDGVVKEMRQAVAGENEVSGVVGLDRSEAQRRLIGEGFEVDVQLRESPVGDDGEVLTQSVPGGKEAEKGTKIVLDVGSGPAPVPVPEVIGLTLPAAEDVLAEAGLKIGEKEEKPSETVPSGEVIEQDPPVGEKTEAGTDINLVLSMGPADPAPETPPAADPAPVDSAPVDPAPVAEAPAVRADVSPDPVVEPEQYEPASRQYESAVPSAEDEPAATPAAPIEQYEEPPVQAPAEEYAEPVIPEDEESDPAEPFLERFGIERDEDEPED